MRKTLILVSQEDLRPLLSNISLPTGIFWGEEDTMTPLSDGKLMHERIKGSTFITFPGVRHRVHRERAEAIGKTVCAALLKK
jgi:pimeloyl-ACP methyl ester carboxylesterase